MATRGKKVRRPKGGKAKAQMRHARSRALERHGVLLGLGRLNEFVRRIQRQDRVEFLERQSHRVTVWRIDGMRVVYDRNRKTIVTVLP